MANGQQFDGINPVPGYTLMLGKNGQSYYLKGEGLSDSVIASKLAEIRGASPGVSQGAPDANAQAQAAVRKPIDQLQEKRYSIFTPTGISGTPEQLNQVEHAQNITTGAVTSLAAGVPAAARLLAPTVGTATAGTGILDATGSEITREIMTYGPSIGRQAVVTAVKWIAANPGKSVIAYQLARAAGVPLPDVLKKLFNVGKAVAAAP